MSNVYENLNSSNFNSHIDSGDLNGGSKITKVMDIGKNARKITGEVILTGGTILATAGLLGGCAPSEAVASTPEPIKITAINTTEEIAIKTSAATPSSSPETTAVLTATEAAFSKERRTELNQQIQDFLNYQGEYSKENIQKYLMTDVDNKLYNFGLIRGNYMDGFTLAGWLFDCIEKDGDLVLVTGFDGKDGQRFVTVLNVPLHFQEKILPDQEVAIFSMGKANVWDFHQSENFIGIFKNTEDLKIALPKDCPALFITTTRKWTDDEIIETGVAESLLDLNRYRRDNTSYVADLLSQVDYNGNTGVDSWLKLDDKKINKIINLSDIDGLDNSTMPVLYGMTLSNFNK